MRFCDERGWKFSYPPLLNTLISRDLFICYVQKQTPGKALSGKSKAEEYKSSGGPGITDLDVLRKYKDKVLGITRYVVADAGLSKQSFVNGHLSEWRISMSSVAWRVDCPPYWYSSGVHHRQREAADRISKARTILILRNSYLQLCEILDIEGRKGLPQFKAYSKAMKRNIKVWFIIQISGGHKESYFLPPDLFLICRQKAHRYTYRYTIPDWRVLPFGIFKQFFRTQLLSRQET